MGLWNFGYHIVESVIKPDYISLNCPQVLNASMCICTFHPSLDGFFWLNHDIDQREYQRELNISDTDFDAMKGTVSELFNENKLDVYSRFTNYADVIAFYDITPVVINRTFSSYENPYIQAFHSWKTTISNSRSNMYLYNL